VYLKSQGVERVPVKRDCQARRRVISATGRAGSATTITTD